jgi:pimeloyl-ACP methyl ester carboxylesterase
VKIMEQKEYHPFKSAEAMDKYLKLYDQVALNWPVSSETRMLDTSYGKTFVRISGPVDAPPLVLLHGMGANSLMWIPNIEVLSKDYRTYAVEDINGNGKSIGTKSFKNSEDIVNWLDELFNALDLRNNINLLGMSYGGWQTSQYAIKFPNRLNKVVLLAPAATVFKVSSSFTIRALLSLLPFGYSTKNMLNWVMEDLVKKDKKSAEELVNGMILASKCYKTRRSPTPTVLSDEELQNFEVPTLYLVGENERVYPPKKAVKRINDLAPQIKTEIIPSAGHDLLSVQPEIVNEEVLKFLKQ